MEGGKKARNYSEEKNIEFKKKDLFLVKGLKLLDCHGKKIKGNSSRNHFLLNHFSENVNSMIKDKQTNPLMYL